MTESAYNAAQNKIARLTTAELDQELEQTAATSETCEMLLCCYLAAMRERGGYREFGYANVYDYANARFGFGARKTRYLVALGRKIESLPKIREALASGKLGWCKAARVAAVATTDNEAMWLESALALSVKDLERRMHDGTDSLASMLSLPLTEDQRILWENVLEIFRRRAGAEISPVEAFEYMLAEVIAEWGHYGAEAASNDVAQDDEVLDEVHEATYTNGVNDADAAPVFGAEAIDTSPVVQGSFWETERDAEKRFAASSDDNELRHLVLERDGWKCCYPGCGARKNLELHHVVFRSRGGCDAPWNLTVVCYFHHHLIHAGRVTLRGRAPLALEWTPPQLMREVLERRRNNPAMWVGELDIREWSLDPATVVT
jgi:hypothetical protein